MPELPEVETVRRGLAATVVGRRLGPVVVTGARTVRRTSGDAVVAGLLRADHRLGAAARQVPPAAARLGTAAPDPPPDERPAPVGAPRLAAVPSTPTWRWGSIRSEELRFVDPRTFGEVVVVDPARLLEEAPGVALLGPDAWDDLGSSRALAARALRPASRALKPLLTDQRAVAGLGNIYADEVLHRAGLSPWRASSSVTADETRRLHRVDEDDPAPRPSRRGAPRWATTSTSTSAATAGSFQERHRVYGREGQPCPSCGRPVERVKWSGRSTFWCPACQA